MRFKPPPVTLNILIINVLVFLVMLLFGDTQVGEFPLKHYFELHPAWDLFGLRETVEIGGKTYYTFMFDGVKKAWPVPYGSFRPIQLVTAMFAHGNFIHLLFNSIAIFFLGSFLERTAGSKHFIGFYLFTGLLSNLLITFLNPEVIPVLGSSTVISGMMVYLAVTHPDMRVSVMFMPPAPLRIVAFLVAAGSVILFFLNWLTPIQILSGVSHFGHLMGMVAGLIWIFPLRPVWDKFLPYGQ